MARCTASTSAMSPARRRARARYPTVTTGIVARRSTRNRATSPSSWRDRRSACTATSRQPPIDGTRDAWTCRSLTPRRQCRDVSFSRLALRPTVARGSSSWSRSAVSSVHSRIGHVDRDDVAAASTPRSHCRRRPLLARAQRRGRAVLLGQRLRQPARQRRARRQSKHRSAVRNPHRRPFAFAQARSTTASPSATTAPPGPGATAATLIALSARSRRRRSRSTTRSTSSPPARATTTRCCCAATAACSASAATTPDSSAGPACRRR